MQDCLLCVGRSKDIDVHYKGLTIYIKRAIVVVNLPFTVLKKTLSIIMIANFVPPTVSSWAVFCFFQKYRADRCVSHQRSICMNSDPDHSLTLFLFYTWWKFSHLHCFFLPFPRQSPHLCWHCKRNETVNSPRFITGDVLRSKNLMLAKPQQTSDNKWP